LYQAAIYPYPRKRGQRQPPEKEKGKKGAPPKPEDLQRITRTQRRNWFKQGGKWRPGEGTTGGGAGAATAEDDKDGVEDDEDEEHDEGTRDTPGARTSANRIDKKRAARQSARARAATSAAAAASETLEAGEWQEGRRKKKGSRRRAKRQVPLGAPMNKSSSRTPNRGSYLEFLLFLGIYNNKAPAFGPCLYIFMSVKGNSETANKKEENIAPHSTSKGICTVLTRASA